MTERKCVVCGESFASYEHETCSKYCQHKFDREQRIERMMATIRAYERHMAEEVLRRTPRIFMLKRRPK